ncbi:Protein of unknown function [Microlunatus sagamiharensis]|uniref:DUF3099 domain-containing protein n=1 Tax=Microlunatus sagamiharensis TaxID=546874 RepID=A0A1H2MBH6_9ACTN|nr:DUF3099 domain-containing protein [Microlunatus sagamiharensis]SDU90385.1 Protein of unknown function [Microlunatus sagamiharensis]
MATTAAPLSSITTARAGASVDTSQRIRRYAITMAFRTACFLLAVTVAHGWLQWALFAGAVFLPYMGVLLANQADEKGLRKPARPADDDAPQLTTGPEPEYVEGVVIDDSETVSGTVR